MADETKTDLNLLKRIQELTHGGARPGSGRRRKTAAELKASGAQASKVTARLAEEQGIPLEEAERQLADPLPPAIDIAETAAQFAEDVVADKIIAGKLQKQSCERFLADLKRDDIAFDAEAAQKIGDYARQVRLKLLPWECFCLANLFGFKRADGARLRNFAYDELGRKNGKTFLKALCILYMADVEGGDCYIAATTRYQSRDVLFRAALKLRGDCPPVMKRSQAFKTALLFNSGGRVEPLAANAEKLAGLNIHCGVLDELGDHANADLLTVFKSATVGRKEPLTLCITTAGNQREANVAWAQRQYALQVLDGTVKDDTFFAFICTPDDGDAWDSEDAFKKSNPSYGILVDVEQMRGQCEKARASMTEQIAFKRYNLNIWPDVSYVTSWFARSDLSKPGVAFLSGGEALSFADRIQVRAEILEKEGRVSRLGLDLGIVSDLTALAAVFQHDDDSFEVLSQYFMPAGCALAQQEPFRSWIAEKLIETTPTSFTDFRFVEEKIKELRRHFTVAELAFDKALAPDLISRLADDGLTVYEVRQGFALSAAILRMEKLIKEGKLCIHGDPVTTWCISNVVLETGARGDFRFSRNKSRDKIDGAVALAIALDAWMNSEQLPYTSTRGILTI